jgi:hypothetical protein
VVDGTQLAAAYQFCEYVEETSTDGYVKVIMYFG